MTGLYMKLWMFGCVVLEKKLVCPAWSLGQAVLAAAMMKHWISDGNCWQLMSDNGVDEEEK